MEKKPCYILVLAILLLTCIFCSCTSRQVTPMSKTDGEEMLLDEAMMLIQAECNMEDAPLRINNGGDSPFAGCILSATKLQSQIVVVALYSLPVDDDAEFFKFKLSEFVVDDLDLGIYRESIHEVFTINRYDGSVERTLGTMETVPLS